MHARRRYQAGHDVSVLSPERRVPTDHPLRPIKAMADAVLSSMSKRFDGMYSSTGRPSIPPERLLKAQILIALYSVRSDRMFCEQLDYNLLFRWFLDMSADDPAFDHSTFTKNGDRSRQRDRGSLDEICDRGSIHDDERGTRCARR